MNSLEPQFRLARCVNYPLAPLQCRARFVSIPMKSRDHHWIKQLVWAYFFLLIFEGALRKWVAPGAANALLVVRDPVVLAAYFLALRGGLFPRNVFVSVVAVLGLVSLTVGMLVTQESPAIALYGVHTNFLQIPFIFLIPRVFDARDVVRVGRWFLWLSMPMAVLMVLQFLAPATSFLNAGASEGADQITSALGRVRPAGTFSFIVGPVYFYSAVAAFLLYSQFAKRYSSWLVWGATLSTLCATAVSGSRSMAASLLLVWLVAIGSGGFIRPFLALRWVGALAVLAVAGLALSNLPFFQFGLQIFTLRVSESSAVEGGSSGFVARFLSGYTGFMPAVFDGPLLGRGLGLGTNVGLALMQDKTQFIWFEDEWRRHILESGPFLGGAFILYRIALTAWIASVAMRVAVRRDPLPILLFGTFFLILLNGLISQATVLGFTIFLAGLCLAAARTPVARTPAARAVRAQTPAETPEQAVTA